MRRPRKLQAAAAALFIVAYPVLSHYSNSVDDAHGLGAFLALAPALTLGGLALWRWARPVVALGAAAAGAAVLAHYWPVFEMEFPRFYVAQDFGLNGLLAATFGRSLLADRVPLCTQFADRLHGPLSARELQYTRRVTAAWAVFFAMLALTTLSLFFAVALRTWSFFSNFCALPLVGFMFLAEFATRWMVLPRRRRGGILDTVRVYFAGSP